MAALRAEAGARLDGLKEEVKALNNALRLEEVEGFDLPAIPAIPQPEIDRDGFPSPLIDSDWEFAEQTRRLKAHKAYENADEED